MPLSFCDIPKDSVVLVKVDILSNLSKFHENVSMAGKALNNCFISKAKGIVDSIDLECFNDPKYENKLDIFKFISYLGQLNIIDFIRLR